MHPASGGVLVDFIGDELMAMWGAGDQPDHAERAARTALAMLARLPGLNVAWQEKLNEPIDFGMGINSGVAWVGNSGTKRKFKYGPSGDTVNSAAGCRGRRSTSRRRLIVSKATHDAIKGKFLSAAGQGEGGEHQRAGRAVPGRAGRHGGLAGAEKRGTRRR